MTVFISASEKYTGVNPATKGVLNKLINLYNGYYEVELNLNDFIRINQLDMILNNEIIRNDNLYFELYNYDKIFNLDLENIKEDVNKEIKIFKADPESDKICYLNDMANYYHLDLEDIEGTLEEALNDYVADHIYENNEVYQYFIIPERDVKLWEDNTSYPIYYDSDIEVYLLGITHFGMSWDYFSTSYKVRQYL